MKIAVLDDNPNDLHTLCTTLDTICSDHMPRPMIHYVDADGRRCSFHLTDGTLLPIATRRKSEVERIYRAYMLKKMRAGFMS